MTTQSAPFGSWKSPITSDLIAAGTTTLSQNQLDGEDIYWIEQRSAEGGRNVVVRRTPDGKIADVTLPPFNARTRVHEYGGGAFAVDGNTIYFSNYDDQRLYRQDPDAPPRPITPAVDLRYADGVIDHRRKRLICVREDHTVAGREAVNTLASVKLDGDDAGGQVLVSGNDFYSNPRLSPDGNRLAWLTWNHPNLPWDGTELWVGELNADGAIGKAERVAGGLRESIFQPEWSPDGALYFASDRTDWWNLYRWRNGAIEPLHEMAAEFGAPQWVFGLSTYAFESPTRIICAYNDGGWRLATLDATTRQFDSIEIPFTHVSYVHAAPGRVVFIGGSATRPSSVVQLDLETRQWDLLRHSTEIAIDPRYFSIPHAIEFPTDHGRTAYAFYYAPKHRDYAAPPDAKPPLLVVSHGGPTSAATTTLTLTIQYW
ncbi:MAG: PD40 domain-containing protein, partial [Chloroflexi bacterium]|nr:PD40 domain-containing protein [Chloroflexota bacterium]